MSWNSCQRILTEYLQIKHGDAKFVFELDLNNHIKNFLTKVITSEESLHYWYDPKTKQLSSQLKTINHSRSNKKDK